MPLPRRLIALLPAVLGACSFVTPFRMPEAARDEPEATALVAVTNAVLKDDPALRWLFMRQTARVTDALRTQPGFLGESRRGSLARGELWTMTAWTGPGALELFIDSEVHSSAIRAATPALLRAKFARFEVTRAELPPSWTRAFEALERGGRSYA